MLRTLTPALLVLAWALPAQAQTLTLPALSPSASATQQVGITDMTVTYSSPGVKDRKVFGDVVKMGELWRAGANAATTIEFSHDVTIGKTSVKAGKYSIFIIPAAKKGGDWTMIVNSVWDQGGTRNYDKAKDAARIASKPVTIPKRERLTYLFANTTDEGTRLDMEWDTVRVSIPIAVDTKAIVAAALEAHKGQAASGLIRAARYMADNGDAKGALVYYDAALTVKESWFGVWLKAKLLADQGDYKSAYPLAEKAHALGLKADYFFWKADVEKALAEWKSKR